MDIRFADLRKKNEKALVAFVSAGDPSIPASLELLTAMCRAGVDILELGVPFSDPAADGPVIQRSSARALKAGATLGKAIEMIRALRKKTDIPIILFSYYNPIFAYGAGSFHRDSVAAGADGALVVDLPPEESGELTDAWGGGDEFALIRLVAPTTPPERMKRIAENASGFLYLISKTGVTGGAGLDIRPVRDKVAELRAATGLPICVGFGIAGPPEARALAPHVDGVVVGSAFERTIEENPDSPNLVQTLEKQVRDYKAAMKTSA
ncbi:MAG TPA: tryptophan synthase subunit alpha [Thermodesulfobacteriota bacterium]|nr:tryptophan synthase subunit alpha [Thermodesulfobacteriota bacterium]